MIGKLEDEYKKQWPKHLAKLTHTCNSTRSGHWLLTPLFNVWLATEATHNFLFPTHEVMGKVKPMDAYVAELIGMQRKALKIAQGITQEEAARQK